METRTDLNRLVDDICASAELVGVPFDRDGVERVISAYPAGFGEGAIELRTTTKPVERRGLSYRFVELDRPMSPYATALEAGLLPRTDRPVDRLLPELCERFEVMGWGVDAEASYGVEKLWPFFAKAYPMSEAYALDSLPPAIRANADFFERHGLTHFSIVAADFRHASANLYFMIPPPQARTVEQIDAMLDDLGMPALREVVEYATGGVALNVTVSYDSPEIERLCLYVPAPDASAVPVQLDPLMAEVVERAPIVADHRSFIPGATFTRSGPYMKLEVDYTGTTLDALRRCVGVPLAG